MKIAFHFNIVNDSTNYALANIKSFSQIVLTERSLHITSKFFSGDLLLHNLARDRSTSGNDITLTFNRQKFIEIVRQWANTGSHIWSTLNEQSLDIVVRHTVYVLCAESLDLTTAQLLDARLRSNPNYIGALEVDETSPVHWAVYGNSLIPSFRIIGRNVYIFWDGVDEDTKGAFLDIELFANMGFIEPSYEGLQGKYSLFDAYHNFEHARRIAEWKQRSGSLLAHVSDHVVSILNDTAPQLGEKLWAALHTFETAETTEQLAQVTASCRRIIEYVTDNLLPPREEEILNGHKIGNHEYKNRLLAYAEQSKRSDTDISLIAVSMNTLAEQVDSLNDLANKGVHAEVFRHETRRCLLRTIILLDDIISLRTSPLPIKTIADQGLLKRH